MSNKGAICFLLLPCKKTEGEKKFFSDICCLENTYFDPLFFRKPNTKCSNLFLVMFFSRIRKTIVQNVIQSQDLLRTRYYVVQLALYEYHRPYFSNIIISQQLTLLSQSQCNNHINNNSNNNNNNNNKLSNTKANKKSKMSIQTTNTSIYSNLFKTESLFVHITQIKHGLWVVLLI